MRRKNVGADKTPSAIVLRYSFTNRRGTIKGGYVTAWSLGAVGDLSHRWMRRYAEAASDPSTYIVWSYDTPIAWHTVSDDGTRTWFVPNVPRSPAQKRHLDLVMNAVGRENEAAVLYGYVPSKVVTEPAPTLVGKE